MFDYIAYLAVSICLTGARGQFSFLASRSQIVLIGAASAQTVTVKYSINMIC